MDMAREEVGRDLQCQEGVRHARWLASGLLEPTVDMERRSRRGRMSAWQRESLGGAGSAKRRSENGREKMGKRSARSAAARNAERDE